MKISILAEGATEKAFEKALSDFIYLCLGPDASRPSIKIRPQGGAIPTGDKLHRLVQQWLAAGADYVIVLTDIHGTEFTSADDAKQKILTWVNHHPKVRAHVALRDFEAWLIPYWDDLCKIAGKKAPKPAGPPEKVNHAKPPAHRIRALFTQGNRNYTKPVTARAILSKHGLERAVEACPELKALTDTILYFARDSPSSSS